MKINRVLLVAVILSTSCTQRFKKEVSPKLKAEGAISDWILLNAKYPKSYVAEKFDSYEYILWDNKNKAQPDFYIRYKHSYLLKTKDGELRNNNHFFVLDKNYRPTMVMSKPSKWLTGIPPSTFEWSNQFSDTILNVDFNGLSITKFNSHYNDWKFLNKLGLDYTYYNYAYDSNTEGFILNFELKNINTIRINHVLEIHLDSQTSLDDLNRYGLNMVNDRHLTDKQVLYFVVISRVNDLSEQYCVMNTDGTTNRITFNVIGSNTKYRVN